MTVLARDPLLIAPRVSRPIHCMTDASRCMKYGYFIIHPQVSGTLKLITGQAKQQNRGPSLALIASKLRDFGAVLERFGHLLGFAAMAMVPSGGGDEGAGGGAWTDSGDGINDLAQEGANPWSMGGPNHPTFCLFKGVADGFAGGLMGSVFGFGAGIFKKQGFKGALREGGSSAKTFAILSGVHSIVSCYLKKVRGKEDAWNAGMAGCATGLALSTPGTPQALAQSCLSFGAFSFVLEYMNQTRPAIAATASSEPSSQPQININNHLHLHLNLPVLPPFTLPPLSFAGPLSFLNEVSGGRARPL